MRILLFGKNGQLGRELSRTLASLGELIVLDYPQIDLSYGEQVRQTVHHVKPQVIVNAAAYTAVDRAESEAETAMAINAEAPAIMAEEAADMGSAFVHYSTDYVFDGTKGEPYCEKDTPNPLNVYGKSKLAGERAIEQTRGAWLILRTSLFCSLRSESFVTNVLQWARKQSTMRIVTDQVSNPTWCRMLAEATAQVLSEGGKNITSWLIERSGVYHLAGDGYASRLELAQEILKLDPRREEQIVENIQPALTAEFPSPARRPLFSALNCDRFFETFGIRLPHWKHALRLAMKSGDNIKTL